MTTKKLTKKATGTHAPTGVHLYFTAKAVTRLRRLLPACQRLGTAIGAFLTGYYAGVAAQGGAR